MERTWTMDRFRPQDAAGVVALYRAVYGENYPVKAVYDPQALIHQEDTGEARRVVARTAAGDVIGHTAFYRSSPPFAGIYEYGQLMIRHDWRQSTVASELFSFGMTEIPSRYGTEAIWGEAVCNHLFTQQFTAWNNFIETGLEVGLMRGESYNKALREESDDRERVSSLLVFRLFKQRSQKLFLPKVYEAALRFIYEADHSGHDFYPAERPLAADAETRATLQSFPGAGVARFSFDELGGDFESRLAYLDSEASSTGAVVTQALLRLTDPCVGAAVDILRRRGYCFGGALPRWFDDDGLMMQKIRPPMDFDKIYVYTKRARWIKEFVKQDLAVVRAVNVGDVLRRSAGLLPDRFAILHPLRNFRLTYAELDRLADTVAGALMALGIERSEHAAIWAPNVPEYLPVEYGCARAGVPLVMVNANFRAAELEYVLKQSDAVVLFMAEGATSQGEYPEILLSVRAGLPRLRHVVLLADTAQPGMQTWRDFISLAGRTDEALLRERILAVSGSDIFTIQYTSGTTGMPKGAMTSHAAYVMNTDAIADRQAWTKDDTVCLPSPFFHALGCLMGLATLTAGGTIAMLERFNATDLLKVMEICRATSVAGTPTMFIAALKELAQREYDLTQLRGGNISGAICSPELVLAVIERMGAKEFGLLYGSTEGLASMMNAATDPLEQRIGTVGRPLPLCEVQLAPFRPTGGDLKAGEDGELCIRGLSLMSCYYKMAEQTAKTVDADGWLHSGDLARLGPDGCGRITGRIKDMIIRGGENIYPAEIETVLLQHPKVLDAQVVGVPCEYYGEDVVAFLRLKPGASAEVIEMKRYCRERIAIHKVPFMFFFTDEYPMTASGKVQKFKLRELAVQKLAINDSLFARKN